MAVVPKKLSEKVEWCENRTETWTDNAVAMGSTAPDVATFVTRTEAARAALSAANIARDAAKDATLVLKQAIAALDVSAAGIVKQVGVKAETTGNPGVYALASIPAPATPTPVGNPGTAYGLKVELKPDGTIEMTWRADNPPGCNRVIWQVYRKVELTGEYTYIGGSGMRKYVDHTVPAGVPSVIYRIMGTRSTSAGDAAEFVVNFGVAGTPPVVTAAATATSAKAAPIAA